MYLGNYTPRNSSASQKKGPEIVYTLTNEEQIVLVKVGIFAPKLNPQLVASVLDVDISYLLRHVCLKNLSESLAMELAVFSGWNLHHYTIYLWIFL